MILYSSITPRGVFCNQGLLCSRRDDSFEFNDKTNHLFWAMKQMRVRDHLICMKWFYTRVYGYDILIWLTKQSSRTAQLGLGIA